ncbi:hypothetical protein N855_gp65 [Mycobacterium phage Muddy]|uniref:Uncharacterized protein n=2 Tax=Mycobacterium phage Muddy TaxID=1340829 RepID=A0ACD4QCG7_9CAUD|nr:hypothetical protein N855_gp65 [Mycobacterium phage Muddy]WEV84109.1 hypothetical protein PBI_MUDDY_65 [Mycobacterium phage Muddy]
MTPIDRALLSITKTFLAVHQLMPTRGEALYAALNKPWEKQNWLALRTFWGNTKRAQRELQRQIDDLEHIAWARELRRG